MTKVKTCPAKVFPLSSLGPPPGLPPVASDEVATSTPATSSHTSTSNIRDLIKFFEKKGHASEAVEPPESPASRNTQRPSTVPATVTATAQVPTVDIEPFGSRKPQVSRGAVLHEGGTCRPCAWYWKPQGCHLGKDCCHCHMCERGEIKSRKRNKKLSLRAQEEGNASDEGARPQC